MKLKHINLEGRRAEEITVPELEALDESFSYLGLNWDAEETEIESAYRSKMQSAKVNSVDVKHLIDLEVAYHNCSHTVQSSTVKDIFHSYKHKDLTQSQIVSPGLGNVIAHYIKALHKYTLSGFADLSFNSSPLAFIFKFIFSSLLALSISSLLIVLYPLYIVFALLGKIFPDQNGKSLSQSLAEKNISREELTGGFILAVIVVLLGFGVYYRLTHDIPSNQPAKETAAETIIPNEHIIPDEPAVETNSNPEEQTSKDSITALPVLADNQKLVHSIPSKETIIPVRTRTGKLKLYIPPGTTLIVNTEKYLNYWYPIEKLNGYIGGANITFDSAPGSDSFFLHRIRDRVYRLATAKPSSGNYYILSGDITRSFENDTLLETGSYSIENNRIKIEMQTETVVLEFVNGFIYREVE